MDRMDNNRATPKKDTGAKGIDNETQIRDDAKERDVEIEQPNPSTANPSIPEEMPVREIR